MFEKTKAAVESIVEALPTMPETVMEVLPTTLESIVLDNDAKQKYMRTIEAYRKQNPNKFKLKESAFIKKLSSM